MYSYLRTRTVLTLLGLFVFTGCITIEENYTFHKDGGGSMEYVVDMSEIGEMMKAFESLDKDKGKKKDDMGTLDLTDELALLKAVPGIKKVKLNDKDEFVQKLRFDFDDVNALNGALNVLFKDTADESHTFFTWEGNTLVRSNNQHARQIGSGMGKSDDPSDTTDMTDFLASMKYNYSFAFADPIASTSKADGMTAETPDARSVKLNTDFAAIANDDGALDLRIELKKP